MEPKRIVVLGGSFNPPTIAHRILLESAMDRLHAEEGIYVPSSDAYVQRKIEKHPDVPAKKLSEETRLRMLENMCTDRTHVNCCEYGDTSRGRTLKTLECIQKQWPGYEVWFVLGADKMPVFCRWPDRKEILSRFYILWTGRNGYYMDRFIADSQLLLAWKTHQNILQEPAGTYNISSSLFWRKFSAGNEECWDILDDRIRDKQKHFA